MERCDSPWSLAPDEVIRLLASNTDKGLTSAEAAQRIKKFGKNVLRPEATMHWLKRLLQQFKSPVVITLMVATIISALLGEMLDAVAICVIVVMNATIGYLHEAKAEAAIRALKQLAAPSARVLRDNAVINIASADICIGDILVFEAGDYVAADARIITANQLSADEAVLTGESLPVEKHLVPLSQNTMLADRRNMIFADTAIATGSGHAIVTAIGSMSEIGHIAVLLVSAKRDTTPLQKRIAQISKQLLIFCSGVVIVIAILSALQHLSWLQILMTSITLAVAAIPEGLPTVVTLALALAIKRMAKRNAIVRHLPEVETLGSTEVICTDKTGTLTTGKMRVREIFEVSIGGELTRASVLCSNASIVGSQVSGDPTELALLYLAQEKDAQFQALREQYPRIAEWSFDGTRKRMSVAIANGDRVEILVKGAPESILPLCELPEAQKKDILNTLQRMTSQGYRVLAVASKMILVRPNEFHPSDFKEPSSIEIGLVFSALVAIADPPRKESIAAIEACKRAGIQIVMITGDHPATAEAIARELGIMERNGGRTLTGSELKSLSLEQLTAIIDQIQVFARVTPEDKLKIVQAWKRRGKIVAMTGDGVNDAPALKEASIGISMGKGGTEVARQASSMILVDDNFATIVSAIEEGRAIYGNIRRTIQYLLSGNLAEILVMFGAALAGWPLPFSPIQLLWINLVTDGFPSLALAAEPVPKDILRTSSRPSPVNFFDQRFYGELIFIGVITMIMALAVYGLSLRYEDELTARTHIFSFMVFAELFRSFASRNEHLTFFQLGIGSNILHLAAVAIPILFQISLHHIPFFQEMFGVRAISWTECGLMLALTLIPVTIIELRKLWMAKK